MKFFSQLGQDRFLLENFFRGRRGGVFVDIGAYDGETFSNTLFFERSMGWKGLCVEPLPSAFAKLKSSRRAICEQVAVADFEGEAEFVESDAGIDEKMLSGLKDKFDPRHVERLERSATARLSRRVPVTRLSSILTRHGLFDIDYCSIDTEGAELSILSDLDLDRFRVSVFTIENNYDDERIPALLTAKGYDYVAKLEQDYVFKRRDVKQLPQVSVICAVEENLSGRDGLLKGVAANLARQSVPVEPIYVFGASEKPSAWLEGRAISSGASLTTYQAWNVALSMVGTPFVMSLDIRNRLAPDAAETLQREIQKASAIAVTARWNVRRNQDETDDVSLCHPALRMATTDHDSIAPIVLWRTEAHLLAPRYPWRLRDGSLLRGAGEVAWERIVREHLKQRIAHLGFVVGNFNGETVGRTQELREAERALLDDPGVSVL